MIECRIMVVGAAPPGLPARGTGWRLVPAGANPLAMAADLALIAADCGWTGQQLDRLALPMLVAVNAAAPALLLDRADGWLLPGDGGEVIDRILPSIRQG